MAEPELEVAAVRNIADWWGRVAVALGGAVATWATDDLVVIDAGGPNGLLNRAVILRPGLDAGDVAGRVLEFYGGRSGGSISIFDPWDATDFGPFGFESGVTLPNMTIDGAALASSVARPAASPAPGRLAVRVDLVSDQRGLDAFQELVRHAFTYVEWTGEPFLVPSLLDGPTHLYLVSVDGEAVACALGHDHQGVTGLYLVGVRREHGRKGLGEAVTRAAAGAFGPRPVTLQASEQGVGLYRRMGFDTIGTIRLWFADRP